MSARADVIVVGSGAGGGVIAGLLAARGREVQLFEAGPHRTAADFSRFEARAARELFWPIRFAQTDVENRVVAMVGGRCVGGSTTINGSVGLRANPEDLEKWAEASAPTNEHGQPLSLSDLDPYYREIEAAMGVRLRRDWAPGVRTLAAGFERLGADLVPLPCYVDHNCMGCGSCLAGCPTNASKSTMVSYLHPALATGLLDLRADHEVTRLLLRPGFKRRYRITGVEYRGPDGQTGTAEADTVVLAAGTLNTPQLLMRSGLEDSPSLQMVGQNLGTHLGRHMYGRFDHPQDLHRAFATTAAIYDHLRDEAGGFLVYASAMMDPIGLAANLVDEDMNPLWGPRLAEWMNEYRNLAGLIVMINDENTGAVELTENGQERFRFPVSAADNAKLDAGMRYVERVFEAAGARETISTGYLTAHVQGTCRMGSDKSRSVVDSNAEAHDVERLFIGDGSIVPRTLSVGPSLTIMALAARVADYIDRDPSRYIAARAAPQESASEAAVY